ncbi:Scr1 family TA system antitoxin-like transcriptional regulator [Streptomyces sp. QH1-20]|uniref:helix-turn-helix domain-containing protein n=1 Tax=Streptomyces sp. QH1-20 TaxID=3240934 RepID=UPI0035155D22
MPAPKELDPSTSIAALYGNKVRKLRLRAGWTQRELGEKVHVTHSRIAKIELGTESPPKQLSDALDEVLGADGDLRDLWPHIGCTPSFMSRALQFFEYEAQATKMYKFSQMIPGLVQTEEYMRALFGAWFCDTPAELEEKVSIRLGRQARLDEPAPPWLWIILDQAVLYRVVGSHGLMGRQLAHLLALTERPHVHLQILPYETPELSTTGGSMTILKLPNGSEVMYVEGIGSGGIIRDPEDVGKYTASYDRMQANALSPAASTDLTRKAMEEHFSCSPSHPA